MITREEKAKRAIILCNAFKDFIAVNSECQDYFQYANICWLLAYNTKQCLIEYEETDDAYYDLIVLSIPGDSRNLTLSANIPVPRLKGTLISEIWKSKPIRRTKRNHDRNPHPDTVWKWKELISEFVFLNLVDFTDPMKREYDVFWVMDYSDMMTRGLVDPVTVVIPQNQEIYDADGDFDIPYHEYDCVQVQKGEHIFWVLKCFKNFFTPVK